jgi:flagellar hook-basal body complex protein FliE
MQTAAIAPLSSTASLEAPRQAGAQQGSGAPFGDLLKNTVAGIDGLQQQAAAAVTGMLNGSGVDVHDAMIATQKADMSFELGLALRNKAVAAYQQVMGMQF